MKPWHFYRVLLPKRAKGGGSKPRRMILYHDPSSGTDHLLYVTTPKAGERAYWSRYRLTFHREHQDFPSTKLTKTSYVYPEDMYPASTDAPKETTGVVKGDFLSELQRALRAMERDRASFVRRLTLLYVTDFTMRQIGRLVWKRICAPPPEDLS